jgi:UDP-2,4-diacetamido-2,4,6-trideoxy-beta-L-altropyranose hydrolase
MLQETIVSANLEAELLINPPNMPELMAWADIAVSAGGSTCWELAFMGVPSIVLVLVENQDAVTEYLMNKKAVLNLGGFAECSKEDIRDACKKLIGSSIARTSLSQQSKTLINGRGSNEVIKSMNRNNLTLRDVTALDRELIWQWANDEETRKASYSQSYIAWNEHIRWFDSVQQQKNHRFYIASNVSKTPVGQIRFALDGKDAIVSLSVAPDSRRRGYGKEILLEAAKKLFSETDIERISAFVKSDNVFSLKTFQKAGFFPVEMAVSCGVESCKMTLKKLTLS